VKHCFVVYLEIHYKLCCDKKIVVEFVNGIRFGFVLLFILSTSRSHLLGFRVALWP
jgi:hypothetical protein